MDIYKLLYKLDMRLNKVDTLDHQDIPNEDKILALNQAQHQLIKKKLNSNNILGVGLDGLKKRYEDLQVLVVHGEEIIPTKSAEKFPCFKLPLTSLQNKYYLPLEIYTLCSKGDCTERVVTVNQIVKHGDLQTLYSNTHYKPSFEYQETLAIISNNELYIYTDGNFTIDKVFISYLRYPKEMDVEGYEKFDGTNSLNIDCELPDILEDELLNLATLELAIDTQNIDSINTNEIRKSNNE